MKDKEKIALFIDADNASAKKIDSILTELGKSGVINIRKAYGNWKNPNLKSWEEVLHEFAIQPIQQFDLTKGKNATDIALVIDVMDVLYTKEIDIICLVSSDCDFTPLVTRVLAEGKQVIGFGERKAAAAFVNSCSNFIYLDSPAEQMQQNTMPEPIMVLKEAIQANEEQNGWASLSAIGKHISSYTDFDKKSYGYKKLSDVFLSIDIFEVKQTSDSAFWVRDKQRAQPCNYFG